MTTNIPAPAPKDAVLTTGQILSLERRSNMTDDEALRFGRAIESALLSKLRAPVADERVAFEKWTGYTEDALSRDAGDGYCIKGVDNQWRAWQARAAQESAPVADERAALEKWMVVDGDMRDPEGLITYHAAAFREGLAIGRAALAIAPVAGEALPTDAQVMKVYAETVAEFADGRGFEAGTVAFARAMLRRYAAPLASEAQCSCPSGDGSLRHPCAVHQDSEAVRDAGITASEDVELPPLPEARIESRQTDSTMRTTVLHTYDEQDMRVYAFDAVVADRQQDAIAWESTTPAYIKFITDSRYRKFSPAVRKWYRPYRCATCAALSAQPGAQKGGSDAE